MALIILGKTKDDKGTQLEQLTRVLLKHQGYSNIVTNIQVGGGSELDVTAERKDVVGIKEIKTPVLCECKAHQTPIALTDWLKFIGKLTIARRTNDRTIGLMLALNGANGAVIGSYKSDFAGDDTIQLIANDDLMSLLQQVYGIPDSDNIRSVFTAVPGLRVEDIHLVYYMRKLYWLVSLGEQQFTLCDSRGNLSERKNIENLLPLLCGSTPYDEDGYVDIFETFELQRRRTILKVRIITELACGRVVNKQVVDTLAKEVGAGKVNIPSLLANDPFLLFEKEKRIISLKDADEINYCDFYRSVLSSLLPVDLIMSDYYQNHIDDNLLDEIWKIQGGFHIDEKDKESCLTILRLSPSSLQYALNPDRLFHGYKAVQGDEQMRALYESHFKSVLFNRFQNDYQNQSLAKMFLAKGFSKASIQTTLSFGEKETTHMMSAKQNFVWIDQKEFGQAVMVVTKEGI